MGAPVWCYNTEVSSLPVHASPVGQGCAHHHPQPRPPPTWPWKWVPTGGVLWVSPGNLPNCTGWIQSGKICLPWCIRTVGRTELLFQAGRPVNVKGHLKMHFKHRNEGPCSGSFLPVMCHLISGPNLPDTSRKFSLWTPLLQLPMPVSHTMAKRTALNTLGYNSDPNWYQ